MKGSAWRTRARRWTKVPIALEPYPQLAELTVEDLPHRLDQVPETIRTAVATLRPDL